MTDDIMKAGSMIAEALVRELGDKVDLVIQFGSLLYGTPHKYSDLDMVWVPREGATWEHITVSVDGILIDLYPMHWPTLENMAEFGNVSLSLLLNNRIVYRRSDEVAERFGTLADRIRTLLKPEARSEMVRKALDIYKKVGYDYYLLRERVRAGDINSSIIHSQNILGTVYHSLMIVNQQQIDTRKLPQVLGLRRLPHGFETLAGKAMAALDPQELLAAIDDLLEATRALLLTEQKKSNGKAVAYTEAFESGYPEFRKALQGILIACERRDIYQAKCGVMGVYRELNCMLARCLEGVEYSDFNSYADYEQNCISLGFPSLMPSVLANDFEHLYDRVLEFDRHLQKFLNENGVALNTFDSLEDLKSFLDAVRL